MAQLNLYIPDDLAEVLEREAAKAGVPLTEFIVSLLSTGKAPAAEGATPEPTQSLDSEL